MVIRYEELTWEEIRDLDKDRVAVFPIATIEDHGPHLPVGTDAIIGEVLCERVCEAMPDETILLPMSTYGFSNHHGDFPGSLNVEPSLLLQYIIGIGLDLANHGFRRLLLTNSHGSNIPIVNIAQNRINYLSEGKILCAATSYLDGETSDDAIEEVRESVYPGGMGHACELETSIMLEIRPELVHMERAKKDIDYPIVPGILHMDWCDGPLVFMPYWSTISTTGTAGDPTLATKEEGAYLMGVAVEGLCKVVKTVKELDYAKYSKRIDHH